MAEVSLVKLPVDELDLTDKNSALMNGSGLMPSGNESLPEPVLTKIYVAI